MKRATIMDVAARAGVSKATVSKYLNASGGYYVARPTRRRIEDAISELDYQPNASAQSLATKRSNVIGVLVPSVANPFYAELVAGVEDVINPSNYTLLLGSSEEDPARELEVVNAMIRRRVDGVVVSAATVKDRWVRRFVDAGIAVVVASREVAGQALDTVVIDNRGGGILAARHLEEHGHPRALFLTGPLNVAPFRLRLDGFSAVYGDAADVVEATGNDLEIATAVARDVLSRPAPPRAIFAATDTIALGVLCAADEVGLRVPTDLALIGFDDIWVSRLPGVKLTTVDSKTRMVGRAAANLLTQQLTAFDGTGRTSPAAPQRMVLRSELVIRRTCGCGSA